MSDSPKAGEVDERVNHTSDPEPEPEAPSVPEDSDSQSLVTPEVFDPPLEEPAAAVATPPSLERAALGASAPISLDTIRERLKLTSPALVQELHETAKERVRFEVERQTRLNTKATSLLASCGVAITLAIVFGGSVVANHDKFSRWIAYPYGAAVLCGLLAAILAVAALRVKATSTIEDTAVFDESTLATAESADPEGPYGLRDYRRYMTEHLWDVYRRKGAENDKSATLVHVGQAFFLGFLVFVIVICGFLICGML